MHLLDKRTFLIGFSQELKLLQVCVFASLRVLLNRRPRFKGRLVR